MQSEPVKPYTDEELATLVATCHPDLCGRYHATIKEDRRKLALAVEALKGIAATNCDCEPFKDGSHSLSCAANQWPVIEAKDALAALTTTNP